MEKERIIWTLEQLRDGDVTSKDYQKRLFDTFVKAVYLWDDKIEVHYYYSGEKNVLTSSLKEAAGGGGSGPGGVLINSPMGHHEKVCNLNGYRLFFFWFPIDFPTVSLISAYAPETPLINWSIRAALSVFIFSVEWAYWLKVKAAVWCPKFSCTVLISSPASREMVA